MFESFFIGWDIMYVFLFNGIQYLNVCGDQICANEFKECQSITNESLQVPFICPIIAKRPMILKRFCFILLELRISLPNHIRFFCLNMVFNCLFYFKESLIRNNVQLFPYRMVLDSTNQSFNEKGFELTFQIKNYLVKHLKICLGAFIFSLCDEKYLSSIFFSRYAYIKVGDESDMVITKANDGDWLQIMVPYPNIYVLYCKKDFTHNIDFFFVTSSKIFCTLCICFLEFISPLQLSKFPLWTHILRSDRCATFDGIVENILICLGRYSFLKACIIIDFISCWGPFYEEIITEIHKVATFMAKTC